MSFNKINLIECNNCGFCFNNAISQEDCNKYYETTNNYTHNLYEDKKINLERYSFLKNLLLNLDIKEDDSIIDLTGYDGSLLNFLKNIGYNNLTYCDLSEKNIANNIYKSYKLNILKKNDYLKINKKYKFIFLNHTLEHVINIHELIKNISLLMDEDSILYIEMPDIDRITINDNPFLELSYEHVNFFNKEKLDNLMNINNFYNINSGIIDFKYRKNLDTKAFYGIYIVNKNISNIITNNITNTIKIKDTLLPYINDCLIISKKIYDSLDKNLEYSFVGLGLFTIYFLSIYKINCLNFYDEVRTGLFLNKKIKKFEEISNNENIIILSPKYYNDIKEKILKLKINSNNIKNIEFNL
jgi:hypothetical protein